MRGACISYNGIVLYPEYCGYSMATLIGTSRGDERLRVASLPWEGRNYVVVLRDGRCLYKRPKYRLHSVEVEQGLTPGTTKPSVVDLDGRRLLILVCYEILFPSDYFDLHCSVDVVLHLVGQPMFSEEQREGWVALQEMLARSFGCPVVCCCGGSRGHMNISGVTSLKGGPR